MSKLVEVMKSSSAKKPNPIYDLTIEQLIEMDEYRARGEVHPLETSVPSRTELRAKVRKYGLQAEEYLQANNYAKYLKLSASLTLEEELIAIDEKVIAFQDKRMEEYRQPNTESYIEAVNHLVAYNQETEERIFEEIIKPFAID